jgi:hypothetical protein
VNNWATAESAAVANFDHNSSIEQADDMAGFSNQTRTFTKFDGIAIPSPAPEMRVSHFGAGHPKVTRRRACKTLFGGCRLCQTVTVTRNTSEI